jgi:uncharacterized protein YerC
MCPKVRSADFDNLPDMTLTLRQLEHVAVVVDEGSSPKRRSALAQRAKVHLPLPRKGGTGA